MPATLKYLFSLIALVLVLSSCTKDQEWLQPATDGVYKSVSLDEVSGEEPQSGLSSGSASGDFRSGDLGDADGDGITDDEDDEDDDDENASAKNSNK